MSIKSTMKFTLIVTMLSIVSGCSIIEEARHIKSQEESPSTTVDTTSHQEVPSADELPIEDDYLVINDNIPFFTNEELMEIEPFADYAPIDNLGRVGVTNALLDQELMPSEERGSIGDVYPSGWDQEKYDNVSGGWLYNRSHLIGHQLTGYDGENNLMTGTRQFNVDGMLPFENFVANIIETKDMRVRYRVTPVFDGNNLLAHGVIMEGYSIDDNGESLTFNVFVPNQQDGIDLNYQTGESNLR